MIISIDLHQKPCGADNTAVIILQMGKMKDKEL
jgi:hypothetical protein